MVAENHSHIQDLFFNNKIVKNNKMENNNKT
jgi:hypothetical protein